MLYPDIESDYPEFTDFNFQLDKPSIGLPLCQISINEHCKTETPAGTFIEYTIVTEMDSSTYIVRRRFSDFDWLMIHLHQKYPLYILPPIPSKRIFTTVDKFNRSFINKRMQALERMMHRLSHLKKCLEDTKTQAFLKYHQREFDLYRQQHKNHSFIKKISVSVVRVYDDTIHAFSGENACAMKDESTLKCFEIFYKRIAERTVLSSMLNSLNCISDEWEIFSFALLWTAQNVADVVLMTEKSEITGILDGVAQFFFNWSTETKLRFNSLAETINPYLNEYIAYDNQIIDIIRQRNNSKTRLGLQKREIFSMQSQLSSDKYDSLPRGNKYDQLMTLSIKLEDQLTDFDRIFYPSYSDWQIQKSRDIASCMNVIVKTNITYHKSCLDMCKDLLNKILNNQI